MNKKDEQMGCLIAACFVLICIGLCFISVYTGLLPATWNAIRYELTRQRPPPPIEQQTVGGALVDQNGDTTATLTGYEMTFPKGVVDWRVTYASRLENGLSNNAVVFNDPTYWCKFADGRWLSCQPVIRETAK